MNDFEIEEAQVVKYLGVLIDNKLSRNFQQINRKISKGIGIIARLRHYVPKNILINIYNSFIQAHINYAVINWGGTFKSTLDPLEESLKHAVRLISFEKRNVHSDPLFRQVNFNNLEECFKMESAKSMFYIIQKKANTTLPDLFTSVTPVHNIRLRQATSGNFSQPAVRTYLKVMSILNQGVKIWNTIPFEIKQSKTKYNFVKALKNGSRNDYKNESCKKSFLSRIGNG